MKISPYFEEVIHITSLFLSSIGYEEFSDRLNLDHPIPTNIRKNNPLIKKGLIKILKEYARNTPKIHAYYQQRGIHIQDLDSQDLSKDQQKKEKMSKRKLSFQKKSQEKQVVSPKASNWMSKFQNPKRLEDIVDPEHGKMKEEAVAKTPETRSKDKKANKKLHKKISSSEYQSEEDSFELEPKKKVKKEVKQQKIIEKKSLKNKKKKETESEEEEEESKPIKKEVKKIEKEIPRPTIEPSSNPNGINGYKQSFSRINKDDIGPIPDELKDNSFEAKFKFGKGGDDWGMHGYERLKDTRGDSFKKTKGKLKNKAFQGSNIDVNRINSIPIL